MRVTALRLDIHRLEPIDRVHDRRQHQLCGICPGESAIAIRRPLHGRPDAIAVSQMNIIAHADFIAVIDDGRARHREKQAVHELNSPAVMFDQRRQPSPDAKIETRPAIGGVGVPEIIAFPVCHHLQGEFIMVSQEYRPLAVLGQLGSLTEDIRDRKAIFLGNRHVDARH